MSEPRDRNPEQSERVSGPDQARPALTAKQEIPQALPAKPSDEAGQEQNDGLWNVKVHGSRIEYQLIAQNVVFQGDGPAVQPDSRPTEINEDNPDGGEKETNGDRARDSSKYSFDDPTLPLPPRTGAPGYRFDGVEVGRWGRLLEEHRLIAVRSPDDGITSAAVHAVVDLTWLRSHERRLLAFGTMNQKRADLFLENLLAGPLGDSDRATILVVDPEGAIPFIESTIGGEDWTRAMTQVLRLENLFVVLQIASRYRQRLEREFKRFRFPCWDVDFLRPLLYRHHPEGKVEDLFARISRQCKKGHWGSRDDDLYLFEVLQPLISGDTASLEEALEPRKQSAEAQASPSAVEVFNKKLTIYQNILVCAAFFRGLDVNEFARIVFKLVGDEIVLISEGELSPGSETSVWPQKKTLKKAWPRVADEILSDCGLVVRMYGGQSTIEFSNPGDRRAFQAHIRNSIYFSSVSEAVWNAGYLFDRNASQEVVDGTTGVFVEALAHHKDWKRPEWLFETLIQRLSNEESADLADKLRNIASDYLVLNRVSQLLRALVAHDDYPELVPSWLDELLGRRGHLPVLQLVMFMRYAEGFDYLFWLKRLTDESPNEIRNLAYSALYSHARQSSVRIWDFLDQLESWLPEFEKPVSALSNSNNFALQLIIEYTVDTAEALPVKEYGSWPPRYPLFRVLAQNPEAADERLSLLVAWIFHPAVSTIFLQDSEDTVWLVRARLLELWSCVLLGIGDDAHPEAQTTYQQILGLFLGKTGRDGRNRLLRHLRSSRENLQAARRKGERQQSEYLARRISLSSRLERDFKSLSERWSVDTALEQ